MKYAYLVSANLLFAGGLAIAQTPEIDEIKSQLDQQKTELAKLKKNIDSSNMELEMVNDQIKNSEYKISSISEKIQDLCGQLAVVSGDKKNNPACQ